MKKQAFWLILLICVVLLVATGCGDKEPEPGRDDATQQKVSRYEEPGLGAGFRYSRYGPLYDPGPQYWADVAQQMASRFPDATPQGIWIVGTVSSRGTLLTLPGESDSRRRITFSGLDLNKEALDLFDELGVQVWLQVEPGEANIEEVIHIILSQYSDHPCVLGVGIDVEWYQSFEYEYGKAVTDAEAEAWVKIARSYGEQYRIFLKHWLIEKMPPTVRDGIVFIDDSQYFESLEGMVAEFAVWGEYFAPAKVGFQFGYKGDEDWWSVLNDPPGEIGAQILAATPNTEALYWVDFTVLDVFPPPEDE